MKARVYIASPLGNAAAARELGDVLRETDYEVVSRWHDSAKDGESDANLDSCSRFAICESNMLDVRLADIVVVCEPKGGKATYFEAGYASALSKPVVWYVPAGAGDCIASEWNGARRVDRFGDLLPVLRELSERRAA